jgi:hypothetical protein
VEEPAGRGVDEQLDVAVRAWAIRDQPDDEEAPRRRGGSRSRVPESFLVFDTETTVDAAQRLLFGCWRYYRTRHSDDGGIELAWMAEGLFHPDDLATRDPEGFEVLRSFEHQRLNIDSRELQANPRLALQSQTAFLNRTLWRAANAARAGVVAFNWPFDISRIARAAGEARNRSKRDTEHETRPRRDSVLDGGFSLMLWPYEKDGRLVQSHYRPAIAIRNIDSKRAFKAFKAAEHVDEADRAPDDPDKVNPDRPSKFRGHFLDVRTLVFALTDRGHNLESACAAFGINYEKRKEEHGRITPDYVAYCREDTEATGQLLEASLNAFLRHPVPLQATRAYSPATIGKSYLRAMNIKPPLARRKVDPRLLGWSMSAYYGGRAECRIRKTPVPVVYCDFLSMYPTVCSLMGIWKLLTTRRINIDEDATTQVQQLLDNLGSDDCFDRRLWPHLVGIAQIAPDGDVVPVRARYSGGQSWQIGVNPLSSTEPPWYTIADLAASKLLTGKAPQILKAVRLSPDPRIATGLEAVDLLSEIPVDPTQPDTDFFQLVVEERKRIEAALGKTDPRARGLKVLANATSYGIYAEMTRHELPNRRRDEITVYGSRDQPHTMKINSPEDPGEFAFPPMAGAITGGARLMLALLEHCVTQEGGSYAFCDTDSMAIVATRDGDLIPCTGGAHQLDGHEAVRALSHRQVDTIRKRFKNLNPYRGELANESILELEDENYADPKTRKRRRQLYCYAISAKRYVLYNQEPGTRPTVRGHTAVDDETDSPDHDEPALRKPSEHGLGQLLHPVDPDDESRDWIAETWEHIIRRHLGLPAPEPDWLDRPAVARTAITSPRLRRQFRALNRGKNYDEQIKPFNFLLVAFVDILERPADEDRIVLIAPYESDRERWLEMPWTNRYSGRVYRLTLEPSGGRERERLITPKTYRDILGSYLAHEEAKSLAPDGDPCEPRTSGLLLRRPVLVRTITHIGKEANQLEDTLTGLVASQDETLNNYEDPEHAYFRDHVVPILRCLGVRETARRTGYSLAAVHDVLTKDAFPRARNRSVYVALAGEVSRGAGKGP